MGVVSGQSDLTIEMGFPKLPVKEKDIRTKVHIALNRNSP